MQKLIALLSLFKWFTELLISGYQLVVKKKDEKKSEEAQDLKKEIENAETEDDFRNAADRLSKLGRK